MIKHSQLIIGLDTQKIETALIEILKSCGIKKTNSPDIYEISGMGKSIGIEEVRQSLEFLKRKPLNSKKKLLLIRNAHKLTPDAQNSLLKTLEEPNSTSQLVLIATSEEKILPTVLSRCIKNYAYKNFEEDDDTKDLAEKFIQSGVGERLAIIDDNKSLFTNRDEAIKFLAHYLICLRANLSKASLDDMKLATQIISDLNSTNLSPRLAIENLALLSQAT